ncbi:hypothetical protein D0T53_03780 [Dysgonomonas sp. 216]|uniref:hypothetical protein n=1 Tax=Dysgonomonas sp. 216 TaxID=2302934 RepID=UPI0013CFE619|nr:hypothetical protein [Dysgonomonas sp. 216]NDW18036.1 hypothetical protein [Dysgonomonas sp. 216]
MTDEQEKMLAEFEIRMRQLMYLCDSLKEQNVSLKAELQEKDKIAHSLQIELAQMKMKYDNLKLAKAIQTGESDELQNAKLKLSRLVRDVDKCIALLKV